MNVFRFIRILTKIELNLGSTWILLVVSFHFGIFFFRSNTHILNAFIHSFNANVLLEMWKFDKRLKHSIYAIETSLTKDRWIEVRRRNPIIFCNRRIFVRILETTSMKSELNKRPQTLQQQQQQQHFSKVI